MFMTNDSVANHSIAHLFENRFEPLRASLGGATLGEVARFLHTEAEFLALQKPTNTFLARVFWGTVLTPVLSAYSDVVARERELAEVDQNMNDIRKRIEDAQGQKNTTPDALIQHARDYDRWQLQLDTRRSALNHAQSRLNALLYPVNQEANDTNIQHVQG
jgi:hypothetical protein